MANSEKKNVENVFQINLITFNFFFFYSSVYTNSYINIFWWTFFLLSVFKTNVMQYLKPVDAEPWVSTDKSSCRVEELSFRESYHIKKKHQKNQGNDHNVWINQTAPQQVCLYDRIWGARFTPKFVHMFHEQPEGPINK